MVLEIAHITVTEGREDEFSEAYRSARKFVSTTPGCLSMRMTRGIESPQSFYLLIEWESVAAHEVGFRQSERFDQWRGAIGEFFAVPPTVEHFEDIGESSA
ncbi:antibiotic biosynthesis monooxygenase family protein [Natronoglycomyces albus]|uniref:Antibiotic biosynthesis monooxygenase n=1 Tax=Natronoglycomyces albus TaxID=2811108 RepID=A0A895XGE2_9ACTN|nr:antibiotic biosynthesis monooxygenase [Natronoglycomyces albus]QSB03937.1 antibiotic biosynthesis monooxygenase [Natronoglycomyces albus]